MTLPSSGAISLNEIHVEAGGSSGSTVSLNDADVRDLLEISDGGTQNFNSYYGAKIKWSITLTVGAGSETTGGGYVDSNTQVYRGYNGSNGTRPATNNTFGSMDDYQDANYLNNKTIAAFAADGSSTASQPTTTKLVLQCADGCSNTDAAFKKVKVGSSTYNRSDATYTDSTRESWEWGTGSQTVTNTSTSTISPMSTPSSTTSIIFRGQ